MDGLVNFLTSKDGVFAAIAAIIGLLAVIVGVVRPMLKDRGERARSRPSLCLSEPTVVDPPPFSEAGHATLEIMNAGGGKAVLRDFRLHVTRHGPTERLRMTEAAAPVPQYTYSVTLRPDAMDYDLQQKQFGRSPSHSFEAGEVESFRIELRSTVPQWYEFELLISWYDVARPAETREVVTPARRIEFLPDVADVL